ncbi:hypothetical protein [Chryseobacterium lactis]|uniref:hypothetical protein n=1 Tax=Chryseobacterium lactis TaxID=1241981 RepID=UPI0016269AFC|nr:hypothetical protein [Chryseobacterium lactis]
MATELMGYKGKGFITSDIFMQLALYYIHEELKKDQYVFIQKETLTDYHLMVINGKMGGWFAFLFFGMSIYQILQKSRRWFKFFKL